MIDRDIIFYDFETGCIDAKTTQPVQIAAVCIDIRNLRIRPDSEFESLMKPILDDEEAISAGVSPLKEDALKKNGKTREQLAKAPEPKQVWASFEEYIKKYAKKSTSNWDLPYRAGFNNKRFDDVIVERLCEKYGPQKKGEQGIFHPAGNIDIYQEVVMMFNNKKLAPNNSSSMDTIREYCGLDTENAHDALCDVQQGAELLIGFLKFFRKYEPKIDFRKR